MRIEPRVSLGSLQLIRRTGVQPKYEEAGSKKLGRIIAPDSELEQTDYAP